MKRSDAAALLLLASALFPVVGVARPPVVPVLDETPIGLRMGMPAADLARLGLDRSRSFDGFEFLDAPPEPWPGESFYLVSHAPSAGLCAVKAVTGFGGKYALYDASEEIRRRRAALRAVAGEEVLVKRVRPAFRATMGPDPTLEGLAQRGQYYLMHWEAPRAHLPPTMSAVRMSLTSNGKVVFLNHTVEFANRNACLVEQVAERLPTFAGVAPLGVRPGAERAELRTMAVPEFAEDGAFRSVLPIVRTPGPEFTFASVLLSEQGGACGLVAKTSAGDEAGDGRFSREVFDTYRQALSAAFGPPELIDGPRVGSVFQPDGDWVAALALGEWRQSAVWTKAAGARLPDGVRDLGLWTRADDEGIPVVTLFYEFDNFDACVAQADREADDVL